MLLPQTGYLDLECSTWQEGCWGTCMAYCRPFVWLPTAASPCWDLVTDHSPRDIKVLGSQLVCFLDLLSLSI